MSSNARIALRSVAAAPLMSPAPYSEAARPRITPGDWAHPYFAIVSSPGAVVHNPTRTFAADGAEDTHAPGQIPGRRKAELGDRRAPSPLVSHLAAGSESALYG
jgi:hypothetical protein